MNLTSLTLFEIQDGLKRGRFDSVELIEACIDQIQAHDPALHAFISIDTHGALQAANELRKLPISLKETKPLLGIPIAVKDIYAVQGHPTTAGSPSKGEPPSEVDASAIKRIKAAGGIILGKCNMNEWAVGATGENLTYGPACNPWDQTRIAGGSSSGSAVALSAGFCPLALGTDTGGSVRVPAALCGVVGMKPSYGRISLQGVVPLSWTLDHAGAMARSVQDVALLLEIMAGPDPLDERTWALRDAEFTDGLDMGIASWRVGVPQMTHFQACSEPVLSMMDQVEHELQALGAVVTHKASDWILEARGNNRTIISVESGVIHQEQIEKHPEKYSMPVLERLHRYTAISSVEYAQALLARSELQRYCHDVFTDVDILITPTTPITAPRIADEDEMGYAREHLSTFLGAFNLAGLPAISIPWSRSPDGLPIGLQLVGGYGQDQKVLTAAYALEQSRAGLGIAPLDGDT